jgi:hypothetical protein
MTPRAFLIQVFTLDSAFVKHRLEKMQCHVLVGSLLPHSSYGRFSQDGFALNESAGFDPRATESRFSYMVPGPVEYPVFELDLAELVADCGGK